MTNEEVTILYQPSDKEQEIIDDVWNKFRTAQADRNRSYRYFNDRSLSDYIGDSMDRWNGYIEPRDDPAEDWGAKVFNNVTRNKTISVIAQVTAERIKGDFFAQNKNDPDDKRSAQLTKQMNDHAAYVNHDEVSQFFATMEAATKGTVIGYESYKTDKRKIKEITKYDADTGEVEYEEKEIVDYNDVCSEVVPLLDVWVGNVYERDIQKMPFIFWRTVMNKKSFDNEFGNFRNADKVQSGGDVAQDDKFKELISEDVESNEYEVIRYFCRSDDEMHVLCNGVLLTPTVSPFPWNHKRYPFWSSVFEPFALDFFYGKSLPDKLKSDQDVLNALYRMMLDQTYLSVNKPIFTTSVEGIKDTYVYPGAKILVDSLDQAREFNISDVSSGQFQMLKLVQDTINEASVDDPSQGVSGSNSTAFEVSVAKEAAVKLLALFLRTLEWGVQQKLELRVRNQFQFYELPDLSGILTGEEQETFSQLRSINVPNTTLADGSTGTQVINVVENQDQMPTKKSLNMKEGALAKQGQNVAFSYVTVEWMKNIDISIHIIPNSSIKMSEALRRALEIDYQAKVMEIYPDLLNREEGFRELNEVYGKDPNKMMVQQQEQPPGMPGQEGMPPEGPPGQVTPPGGSQPNKRNLPVKELAGGQGMQRKGTPGANEIMNSPRGVIREGAKRA